MDHETTTWITLVHASTRLHFSRCVVFCFLSNLVPFSTVALPLLASRVLSEVARRQLFIVEGLSARHLVAYANLFFLFTVKHKEIWSRQKVNNETPGSHFSRVHRVIYHPLRCVVFC